MATTSRQIYSIVNTVAQQAMGQSALAVVDNSSLIAMGNTVLGNATTMNNFITALTDRIGRTIVSYRAYHNHFPDFERDSMEWGQILQKLKSAMPSAEADQAYDLADGKSVDMYTVNKPKTVQNLFTSQTPWQLHVTIHDWMLEDAFTSTEKMGSFISSIFGEVQNAIELETETMAMDAVNNYIAELHGTTREVKLLTLYKDAGGTDYTTNPLLALNDSAFLTFFVKTFNKISLTMERMLYGRYNTVGADPNKAMTRHTPKDMQRCLLNIDMVNALKTDIYSKAYNKNETTLDLDFKCVPFWQNPDSNMGINVKKASNSMVTAVANVVGILFDREAMGTFKNRFRTSTTPINSAGMYYNVYYHMIKMYFNDLSENAVTFVLA